MASKIAPSLGFISLGLILFASSPVTSKSSIDLVQILMRHGDRAPVYSFPTDPWSHMWQNIQGEITPIGKQQGFKFGQFLRKRYVGSLLRNPYLPDEVYVRSTALSRTIATAYNVMAGLYPPTSCKPWSADDPWTIIPVHTVPRHLDWLLWIPTRNVALCPKHDALTAEMKETLKPYYAYLTETNKDFIDFISNKSGRLIDDIRYLDVITDVLNVEVAHNLSIPDWANSTVLEKLRGRLNKYYLETSLNSVQQIRLRSGPVVKTMLENIEDHINEKVVTTKLYLYSAHDLTLSGVLLALGIHNGLNPPYSAALIMELLNIDDEYYVKMLYRNDTKHSPYVLTLPNCANPCPLAIFVDNVKDVVPVNILDECELPKEYVMDIGIP